MKEDKQMKEDKHMKTMRVVIATCAVLAATSSVAKADIILLGATPAAAFVDLGAQGFGNDPRLLTLQTKDFESGGVTPVNQVNGDAILGANKSTTPTLTALGWNSGAAVGIGFNADQSGGTGITLDTLTLTIYNGTTAVSPVFSLKTPINFSATDLALQHGNGTAVFNFGLNATEQAQFTTILLMSGSSLFTAGLASSLGCNGTPSPTCQVSNGGPDSYIGFAQVPSVPVPDGGMTLMLLGSAFVGLETLRRRFRA
jgi:hypothetical protein